MGHLDGEPGGDDCTGSGVDSDEEAFAPVNICLKI